MKLIAVQTGRTKGGGFKAYLWGQADEHISDWRGCNYRTRAIPGQPLRGWKTRADAEAFARRRLPTKEHAIEMAGDIGDGTHLTDARFTFMEMQDVDLPSVPRTPKLERKSYAMKDIEL